MNDDLTVKELKEVLESLPDDAVVSADGDPCNGSSILIHKNSEPGAQELWSRET